MNILKNALSNYKAEEALSIKFIHEFKEKLLFAKEFNAIAFEIEPRTPSYRRCNDDKLKVALKLAKQLIRYYEISATVTLLAEYKSIYIVFDNSYKLKPFDFIGTSFIYNTNKLGETL